MKSLIVVASLLFASAAFASPTKVYNFGCVVGGSGRTATSCSTDSNANAGANNMNLAAGDKTIVIVGAAGTQGSGFNFGDVTVFAYGTAPTPIPVGQGATLSYHGAQVIYTATTSAAITGVSGYKCRWSNPGGQAPDAAVCRVLVYAGTATVNQLNPAFTGWGQSGSLIFSFTTSYDNSDVVYALTNDVNYVGSPLYGVSPLSANSSARSCGTYTDYMHTTLAGSYQVGVVSPSSSSSWAGLAIEVQNP